MRVSEILDMALIGNEHWEVGREGAVWCIALSPSWTDCFSHKH